MAKELDAKNVTIRNEILENLRRLSSPPDVDPTINLREEITKLKEILTPLEFKLLATEDALKEAKANANSANEREKQSFQEIAVLKAEISSLQRQMSSETLASVRLQSVESEKRALETQLQQAKSELTSKSADLQLCIDNKTSLSVELRAATELLQQARASLIEAASKECQVQAEMERKIEETRKELLRGIDEEKARMSRHYVSRIDELKEEKGATAAKVVDTAAQLDQVKRQKEEMVCRSIKQPFQC
jgi:chromosome segregation ATPase